MLQRMSGSAHSFTERAKLDIMNDHPPARANESRDANHVQHWPWMLVVRIDESQLEICFPSDVFDMTRVFARMHADAARQVRNKPRNLETNAHRLIGKAAFVQIDRIHDYRLGFRRLMLDNGVSNHRRREAA